MTRKDYILIASALVTAREFCEASGLPTSSHNAYIESMAQTLRRDNPAFDRAKFVKACQ